MCAYSNNCIIECFPAYISCIETMWHCISFVKLTSFKCELGGMTIVRKIQLLYLIVIIIERCLKP